MDQNTIPWQRDHWRGVLLREAVGPWADLGRLWGNPEEAGDPLGNYASVLARLRERLGPERTVLEIGSYGGKWTQYLLAGAGRTICVDLFSESEMVLRQRFGPAAAFEFVQTTGADLAGVSDGSVDLVFSMDSLVRAPLDAIASYLRESARVLRSGGETLIHLPCDESAGSRARGFTAGVSRAWAVNVLRSAGFSVYRLDAVTLVHGILVQAVKS